MIMDKCDHDDARRRYSSGDYVERRYGIGYDGDSGLYLASETRREKRPPPFARARYPSPAELDHAQCPTPPSPPLSSTTSNPSTGLATPRTPRSASVDLPHLCPFCDTAYDSPEYTPAELEQLDVLHALGNWAWEDKCRLRLESLSSPWTRLYQHRPAFAEAMGACVRAQLHEYLRRLTAKMAAQQLRINDTLTSLKRAIICAGTRHDPDIAAKAWEAWSARHAWTPARLACVYEEGGDALTPRALELFRDVLKDLGESEVDSA